jgi:hypothetical protein
MGASALLAAADDITRQVANLRGLEPKRSVAKGVLGRDAIGAKLRERIGKEYTPEEVRVEARTLKRLGLLPADADYEKLLIDLLMEQVAGFYDPYERQLYIADWLGMELQRPALAHEIEHALQDQYFDLKGFSEPIKDDGDRQLARSALVEGDGTAVMLEFVAQSLGLDLAKLKAPSVMDQLGSQLAAGAMNQSPVFTRAPRFLRETLIFPYFAGMNFVLKLRGSGAWSRVDELFKRPPESTEQVIHPDKYVAHEPPVPVVPAPIEALAPAKVLRRDVLGELEFRVLLSSRLDDGVAGRAAEGWGGDRLVVYGEPDANDGKAPPLPSLVDLSTWDTVKDAEEIESALRALFALQTGRPDPHGKAAAVFEQGGESWFVERRGQSVLALFGVPSSSRAAVADEVWRKWKVGATPRP